MAPTTRLTEAGYEKDEMPYLAFNTTTNPFNGQFYLQFAAAKQDGDVVFAIADTSGNAVGAFPPTDEVLEFIDAIIEQGSYRAYTNYESETHDSVGEGEIELVLGRSIGKEFDSEETIRLDDPDIEALKEIRDYLTDTPEQ